MALQFAPTIISPIASFWKEENKPLVATVKIQHNNQFSWRETPNLKVKMWDFNDKAAETVYTWESVIPNDNNEKTTITLALPENFPADSLNVTYKLQVAYSAYRKDLDTWSQVKIIKYLKAPIISLNKKDLFFNISLEGEKIRRYRFNEQDWEQIDKNATSFPFLPPKDFISNDKLVVSVETVTGAVATKEYSKNIETIGSLAEIKQDVERGFIYFKADAEAAENKILYLAQGDECQILGDSTQTLFIDPYVEALRPKQYYKVYAVDENTIKTELLHNSSFLLDYEYSYLCDKDYVLNLKYNGLVSSFKKTIQEQKQDTIGGLYPYIFRNESGGYAEIPLSALIASDLGEFKIGDPDADNSEYRITTSVGVTDNPYALGEKYKKEKEYREQVYNWLINGKPKIFKSPTEGIYIVQVMNTSMSAKKELGNLLYEVSGTMYEVDNISDYAMKVYRGDYD